MTEQKSEKPFLKVMSYNIRHARGMDNKLDLHRLARFIQEQDPDIIGLQEVDCCFSERSEYVDQAAFIAKFLHMEYVYGGSIVYEPTAASGGHPRKHGAAILSKHPIISSKQYLYEHYVGNKRELLEAVIAFAGNKIAFYSTHLGLNAEERKKQAEELMQIVSADSKPKIVVGDFNAEAESPEMKIVRKHLIDAFSLTEKACTFRADAPTKRIDYILSTPHFQFSDSKVISTQISDHLPIVSHAYLK